MTGIFYSRISTPDEVGQLGLSLETLRRYCVVAHAWPPEKRALAESWTIHEIFARNPTGSASTRSKVRRRGSLIGHPTRHNEYTLANRIIRSPLRSASSA